MTQEEKAKAYDEALLRADEAVQKGCLDNDMFDIIFPPEESEDERIRKGLLKIFKQSQNGHWAGMEIKDIVAYLEKQKEQKPAEWSEEDEKIIQSLILEFNKYVFFAGIEANKIISFLKSLRPQYNGDVTMTEAYKMGKEAGEASHWKPSEEQMNALNFAITYMFSTKANPTVLRDLYNDLLKLQ